jgi:hypothetical protein
MNILQIIYFKTKYTNEMTIKQNKNNQLNTHNQQNTTKQP